MMTIGFSCSLDYWTTFEGGFFSMNMFMLSKLTIPAAAWLGKYYLLLPKGGGAY
jgi:hypothetical protein